MSRKKRTGRISSFNIHLILVKSCTEVNDKDKRIDVANNPVYRVVSWALDQQIDLYKV